jgi:hypothetical protein
MKYLKTAIISDYGTKGSAFVINPYGRISTNSTNSFQLPSGTTDQRPQVSLRQPGMLRYNEDLQTVEGYINGTWEVVKGATDGAITRQVIAGNPLEPLYGPLAKVPANPENILVFVDTTIQYSSINFNLITYATPTGSSPSRSNDPYPVGTYIQFTDSDTIPTGINLTVFFGFDA